MQIIRHILKRLLLVAVLFTGMGMTMPPQETPVPVNVQLSLVSRILSFDRLFTTRSEGEVVVGIVYQRTFRPSLNMKENVVQTLHESATAFVANKTVRVVEIDLSNTPGQLAEESLREVDVLYIAPLRAIEISSIATATQAKKIRSFTGVSEYVVAGIAVGFGTRGDRPEIIVNLQSAKSEGAEYSSQLLKLAKVIQ